MPAGRPTKLTETFLAVAHGVLNDGVNAIIFTDKELLAEINERLTEEERIEHTTFERWKAGVTEDSRGEDFRGLIEKALRKQKAELFRKFQSEQNQWQRWAWIIERKFKEWNLPYRHAHGGDPDNTEPIYFVSHILHEEDRTPVLPPAGSECSPQESQAV